MAAIRLTLIAVLILCFGPGVASASPSLPIVLSHAITLGYFPAGGWDSGQSPLSGSFVFGPNGHVYVGIEWGGGILDIAPDGTTSKPFDLSGQYTWNGGPTAIDGYGNLYVTADGYDPNIYKIPYDPATGAYPGMTTAPTATCQGGTSDAAPCLFAKSFSSTVFTNGSGFASLAFDNSGNFFLATDANPTTNKNSIYECNASCQTGSGAPTLLYADTKNMGAIAVDPWGNIYFSDGDNSASTGVTNLKELVYSSGGYASTPTTVESYTNAVTYGNGFSGVAVDSRGTVYFATNADGIFAIPSTEAGGPDAAGMYQVGSGGGYGITLDPRGNVYLVHYTSSQPAGDANYAVDEYVMNRMGLGQTPVGGAAKTLTATIYDSAGSCTPTLTLNSMQGGVATTEFSPTPGSSCSAELGTSNGTFSPSVSLTGARLSVTVTFNPAQAGVRTALLEIGDSAAGATGAAALAGTGLGPWASLDPGTWNSVTTGLSGPTAIVGDASGGVVVADQSAGKLYYIAGGSGTPTLTAFGSGFTAPNGLAFDPDSNLYVSDPTLGIVEIANTGTSGFVPGTQTAVLSPTTLIGGTALGSQPAGIGIGSGGNMFIVDQENARVVSYSYLNGVTGTTLLNAANGLVAPAGIAVDSVNGYVCVADSSVGKVFLLNGGVVSSLTVPGVTKPTGVATDNSGSLLVTDAITKTIVYVPWSSGGFDTSKAFVIENLPAAPDQLTIKGNGNLFFASKSSKAAYAIYREQGAVDFGPVQNGLTNSATVYLTNSGNAAVTLGTPFITQSTNTMFTLAAASQNGCTDGSTGNPGQSCAMTSTFAPLVGTPDQTLESGTATLSFGTAGSAPVNMSGTAVQSAVLAQTITNFTAPATMQAGQQAMLSATGGASGNPVVFTIDAASPCTSCASVNGSTLIALGAGTVIVDANQAGGQANGNQYAAAPQVQATVVISNNLVPAGVPALQLNQHSFLFPIPNAGFTDGQNPQGGSFAVTQDGEIVMGNTYGNTVYFVNAQTGALIQSVTVNGPGGITVDSKNNLYVAHLYNSIIYKVPFANGGYALVDNPSPAPPACTGNDTAECTFVTYPSTPTPPNSGGIKAIAFDPSGNFYMVSEPSTSSPGSGASYIYECNTSCQPAGTGVVLYSDPDGISQIAFDPWGNLYFTDANYLVAGANNESNSGASSTSLNELPYTAGTGFAATPTVLQKFTNTSPGNYDDMLASVAVNQTNGTIYYGILYDGTFAIPNSQSGGPAATSQYAVSSQGAKALHADASGNLYLIANTSGKDTAGILRLGDVVTPGGQFDGAPVTASASVVDSAFGCGTAATVAIASSNPEFAGTVGTTCSGIGAGDGTLSAALLPLSSYPATLTFAATNVGTQTANLSLSDTTNGGTGSATVTGVGLATPQTITFTAPITTTYTYSPTLTVAFAATGGGSNNPVIFSVDASSSGAGTFSGDTLTVTQAGTIVVDANEAGGLVNGTYYYNATQAQLTITVDQAAQTILFAPPASPVTYAPGLTVTLTATGGASGNPVTFSVDSSSSGAGTVSGNTLTVTQAGTIVINANQAANVDYLAATAVQQTLVVNKASQTITFIPLSQPFHFIAGGATLTIQATGGGSNDAITFSVDASSTMTGSFSASTVSGATSSALLTLPVQTATSGTITIDAMQPGNANYADSAVTQETINILSPLPTQTITFTNPGTQVVGTPLALTATATSGFPVDYVASPSTVCTVSGSTATFVAAGTCTIIAMQPGDNIYFAAAPSVSQTFTVNPTGQVPAMNVNLSLSSLTIQQGTVGLTQLTVTSSNNFTGQVTFACSGQPSGYSCVFNPNPINVGEDATATTNLTVTPGSTNAALHRDFRPLFPIAFAFAFCLFGFKKRSRLQLFLLAVIALFGLSLFTACGGSSSTKQTQATTSTITVTATSGAMKSSATLTVIVQ